MKNGSHLPSRRGFLTVGAVAGLGLHLGDFFWLRRAQAEQQQQTTPKAKANGVIHIFLPGGYAHQETFDPKPYAPIEYRGDFKAIPTKIAGEMFCETLAKTANIADKLTVVRSLTHGEAAHERGVHNMFTGSRPSPALVFPSMGSVVSHEFGSRNNLPPYICVPNQPNQFAGPGYLSSSFAPFSLGADPANKGFKVRDLALANGIDTQRETRRRTALEAVNQHFIAKERADAVGAMNTFYQRAFDLISSQAAREAFNIDAEPDKLRDAYGRSSAGARMLMARRLIEAGTRFVTLTYGGWDHHRQIAPQIRSQVPAFDQAFAALIDDLNQRGLLDETLVMVSTEFGRTPKINRDAGRDHWSRVFSVVLAGGGVKRGLVHGSSGPTASEPESGALSPEDLTTTVFHQLGINAEKRLLAPGDRPVQIVKGGQVRRELLVYE